MSKPSSIARAAAWRRPTMVAASTVSRSAAVVQRFVSAPGVEHLDDVGHQDVVVWRRITGPGRGVPRHRIGEPTRRGSGLNPSTSTAPILEPAIQPLHGRRGLDVEDRVHLLGPVHDAENGDRLVRGHDELEWGPSRRHQPLVGGWVGGTHPDRRLPRSSRESPRRLGRGALGAGATPPQRRLTSRAVVGERCAGVVVLAADDNRLVVCDLGEAHWAEPCHGQVPPEVLGDIPGVGQPTVAIVFAIGWRCPPAGFPGLDKRFSMTGSWRSMPDRPSRRHGSSVGCPCSQRDFVSGRRPGDWEEMVSNGAS